MLIKRQLLVFFRDRAAVFFSLMSVLMIFALYILFLGNVLAQPLRAFFGDVAGIDNIVGGLMLGGLVAVAALTGCLGAFEIFVSDKKRASMDFMTSPTSRRKLSLQYVLGSSVVGLIMTLAALVLVMAYLTFNGAPLPGLQNMALLLFTVILSVLCGNAFVFFIIQFVNGTNAYAAVSAVVGSLIGFVAGVFVPIGTMPAAVQWIIRIFPMSHSAAMFRQILVDEQLEQLFYGAPAEYLENFRLSQGITYAFGDLIINFWHSAAVLTLSAITFFTLGLIFMKKRQK